MIRRTAMFTLMVLWAAVLAQPGLSFAQDMARKDPIETADFFLKPRADYKATFWIIERKTNKPIGYARWDPVQRRYTLFNLHNKYMGFYQATLGRRRLQSYVPRWNTDFWNTVKGAHHYQQYLAYDKNNRYMGVYILSLGGRPTSPEVPFGELGGDMVEYKIGNIPVPYPYVDVFFPRHKRLDNLIGADVTDPNP